MMFVEFGILDLLRMPSDDLCITGRLGCVSGSNEVCQQNPHQPHL